jgi:hypothetical protein
MINLEYIKGSINQISKNNNLDWGLHIQYVKWIYSYLYLEGKFLGEMWVINVFIHWKQLSLVSSKMLFKYIYGLI